MAGVIFPDIGRTLVPLIQMDQQREREERQDARHSQERSENMAIRKEESDYRRANLEEQKALRLQNHIASMDEKTRAKVKEFSEFRSRGGMAVLSAPPEQQEQAYGMFLQEAKSRGYDMSLFPQQWGAATKNRLQFDVDQAKPFADFFNQPQAMPPVGGGAPAAAPGGAAGGYQSTLRGYESPDGRSNPQSGAVGFYHFMPDTWAKVRAANPDLNLPPDVRQADEKQQGAAEERFRAGNATELQKAGLPPTPANLYIAHRAGAQGAQTILTADPNAPMASIVPAIWLQQNPDMRTTVGEFVRMAQGRFPGSQPTMGTPPPSMVAQGANAAQMPNVSPQQVGAIPGTPAQMPNGPQFAQAGGVIPQGDAVAGQGDVMTPPRAAPPQEHQPLRQWLHQSYPGAAPFRQKDGNLQYDSRGYLRVKFSDGTEDYIPNPEMQAKQKQEQEKGRLDQEKGARDATKQSTEQANKLRDDFRSEPVVKSYRVVVPMLESAKEAGPSRAGDLNLIYAFAKLMDPESVVRESETGMVVATGTVADRLSGLIGQLNGGQTLQPETRAKLIAELESRFKSIETSYKEIENAYGEIADSNGVKRSHVILPIRAAKKPEEKGAAAATSGAQGPKMSPEEASKLPPGTPFIGMDGVPRVRN
jgi:hypothetical protein